AAADPQRRAGGARSCPDHRGAAHRRGAEPLPRRGAWRGHLLSRLQGRAGGPAGYQALPRRSLPGARGRGAGAAVRGRRADRSRDGLLSRALRKRPECDDRRTAGRPARRSCGAEADRRGRCVRIFVPGDAAACAVGADAVAAAAGAGAIRNGSRGMFELEPLLEIETAQGRIGFAKVTAEDVPAILARGTDHPKCVGPVDELPFLKRQTRLTFARCGITDPQSMADYKAHGGLKGLACAIALGPEATVEEVVQSGLRGRGGAGFPAGIKWRSAAGATDDRKYIVCNADEGDSGTFADRMVMEGDPFMLIEGMAIAGLAVGATKGYIYIRSEYPHAIRAMQRAVEPARQHGLLGRLLRSDHEFD